MLSTIASEIHVLPATTRALLFDLDGTIIDNMGFHYHAWQSLLKDLGESWSLERVKAEIWGKNEDIFERIFPGRYTPDEVRSLALSKEERYIECYRPHIRMLLGLEELLCEAREAGVKLAVATAAPRVCVDFVVGALEFTRYFEQIVHADMVARSKPHPETFLTAASLLGVIPENCVVFEDAPVGVKSADAAGMRSLVLLTTHERAEFSEFESVMGFTTDYTSVKLST